MKENAFKVGKKQIRVQKQFSNFHQARVTDQSWPHEYITVRRNSPVEDNVNP